MIVHMARLLHVSNGTFYTLLFGTLIISFLLIGVALNRFVHYWAKRVHEGWIQVFFFLLESLPVPLLLICSLYLGMESLPLDPHYERVGSKLIFALVLLVMAYFPAKVIVLALRRMSQKDPALERVTQPASFIVRALFALLATIIFLENLNISLTAVWTTLGVGSVAVALALQETLSNFFSGLYLLADHPVNPGDYIRLDSNQEGYVVQIGWRSTILRTLSSNYVVIPNATMAKAVITNFSLPQPNMSFSLTVNVAYGTDPARVEKVLLSIASEAIHDGLPGLLADPAPSVSFIPGFGDSALGFSLGMNLRRFDDQYSVQTDLRKRIVKRFKEEGIEMPYPTRTLVLDKSAKDLLSGGSQS